MRENVVGVCGNELLGDNNCFVELAGGLKRMHQAMGGVSIRGVSSKTGPKAGNSGGKIARGEAIDGIIVMGFCG